MGRRVVDVHINPVSTLPTSSMNKTCDQLGGTRQFGKTNEIQTRQDVRKIRGVRRISEKHNKLKLRGYPKILKRHDIPRIKKDIRKIRPRIRSHTRAQFRNHVKARIRNHMNAHIANHVNAHMRNQNDVHIQIHINAQIRNHIAFRGRSKFEKPLKK